MTLEEIFNALYAVGVKFMSLTIPIGEFNISFWALFLGSAVIALLARLIWGLLN